MNLYRIGNKVLNLDRVNGLIEVPATTAPDGTAAEAALRVVFDHGCIDLTGKDAEVLRRWYRRASQNLAPHRDEDGEELVSPEDQVRESLHTLVARIDRMRPSDASLRGAAHRVRTIVGRFLTGELPPARADEFKARFDESHTGG